MHGQPLKRRAFLRRVSAAVSASLLATCTPEQRMQPRVPQRNGISGAATAVPASADLAARVPIVLEQQAADLTVRFQHIAPTFTPEGLVGAWTFNEGSGYRFRDVTGRGHDAYVTGPTWNTTDSGLTASLHGRGNRGGAVHLQGAQWLQVQSAPELQLQNQRTIMAWIRLAQLAAQPLLTQGTNEYSLRVSADGALLFMVGDRVIQSDAARITANTWHHLAATTDLKRGLVRLYLDGVRVASADAATLSVGSGEGDLYLGGDERGESMLGGWFSEVTLHNRALNEQEIAHWRAVGMPVIYRQTRETIDTGKTVWTAWKGNEPIPHPIEPDTVFTARYNGTTMSDQGHSPERGEPQTVPGVFGGALDTRRGGLRYKSPITAPQGTFEAWVLPATESAATRQSLFRAEGRGGWLDVTLENGRWRASTGTGETTSNSVEGPAWQPTADRALHVAVAWGADSGGTSLLGLFLNGTEVARTSAQPNTFPRYNQTIQLGGTGGQAFQGAIDDVRISGETRGWGGICPHGHIATEAASLDPRDQFVHEPTEPLRLWRAGSSGAQWSYTGQALQQITEGGFHPLFHPNAYGHMSSIEAGVTFAGPGDGWAGIFVQGSAPGEPFGGYSFALNPRQGAMRIAAHKGGKQVAEKILPYDFAIAAQAVYTLTLTSADDGVLRGYVDGNSAMSLGRQALPAFTQGHAGLFIDGVAASFSDVHFSALTPATAESRLIEQRLFVDGQTVADAGGYSALTLSPFRWHKWHGQLPWQRGGTYPEPPGALFGPNDGVARPNPPAAWRSEDSANSDVFVVNGTVYYVMRGNPRAATTHGPAALGMHSVPAAQFDGRHFSDHNLAVADVQNAHLLRGHLDTAPDAMRDAGPRRERFQVNDQGGAYVGEGKILLFAREFRNRVGANPWYRRLGFGMYDLATNTWQQPEISYVQWSRMEPDKPAAQHQGIDATPEIVALRDPETDEYTVFLFHHQNGSRIGGVSGLALRENTVVLDQRYPQRDSFAEESGNVAYGERVLFDNGIYYLHYNAASTSAKMNQDWPDRFHLAASLHPYAQTFVNSADTPREEQPYFGRGEAGDFDNAAIWQGCMLKYRGRYYLYYEAYHAIGSVDTPYASYDDLSAGSRAGYATAN